MEIRERIRVIGESEKVKCVPRHSWASSGRRESVAEHSFMPAAMLGRKENKEMATERRTGTGKAAAGRGDKYKKKGRYASKDGSALETGHAEKGKRTGEYIKKEKNEPEKRNGGNERGKRTAGNRKEYGEEFRPARMGKEVQKGKSRCRAFGECGGCQMLHLPYEEQLALKEKETAKLLKPYVRLEGIIGMEEPEHYRNKVSAAFTHDRQGKPLSGVYKEGTHYIIPIEACVLENEKADAIIASVRALLPSFKIKTYDEDSGYGLLRHVVVRIGQKTGQIMVVLVLSSPILPSKNNFVKALLKQHPDITTIVINVNDRKTSMVLGDKGQTIYGKGYIEDVLCGITFRISPKSFYQVNAVQTEKLYRKAVGYAGLTGKETVLDAYCGIGTIGMIAAGKAGRVIGVELNGDAVRDAVANARRNQIGNIDFYEKDAGEFMVQLAEQKERVDTVFMDPPRTGSDEVFLNSLVELAPKKIVYISCNPETLARDLEYMGKRGYRAVKGVCVDMFPFCGHVESIVLLSKFKSNKLKICKMEKSEGESGKQS